MFYRNDFDDRLSTTGIIALKHIFYPFPYRFDMGKREPYNFGVGKRLPYNFGVGKRAPYNFGVGKRRLEDLDTFYMKSMPYNFGVGR